MYNDTRVLIYQSSDTRQLRVPDCPVASDPPVSRNTKTNLRTGHGDDATMDDQPPYRTGRWRRRDARREVHTHNPSESPDLHPIRTDVRLNESASPAPRRDETRFTDSHTPHCTRARRNKSRATAPQGPRHHLPLALTRSQRESVLTVSYHCPTFARFPNEPSHLRSMSVSLTCSSCYELERERERERERESSDPAHGAVCCRIHCHPPQAHLALVQAYAGTGSRPITLRSRARFSLDSAVSSPPASKLAW